VNCDVTLNKDHVDLGDCKKYGETNVSQLKHKSADFCFDMTDKSVGK
jgi:hypothetical protein